MVRHKILLAAALAAVASACQQDSVTSPMIAAPHLAAQSGGVETNVRAPFDINLWIPCGNGGQGEFVHLTGTLHSTFNVLNDGRGGFHIKIQDHPQGLRGVGEDTGDKYQGTGGTRERENAVAAGTYSYVNNFRFVGQGKGNNFAIHENVKYTVNALGEITVDRVQAFGSCK